MNAAQLIVKTLEAFEIDVIFGYPGAHNIYVYDALRDSKIRHVLVRHEQAAAYMADGYARATGKPGVCLTTAGPGATNAATAIAEAYDDSVPVLHLAGQVEASRIRAECGAYHEMDLLAIFRPMTKWVAEVKDPHQAAELIEAAFRQMAHGRPRPVHISLPNDVLKAEARADVPEDAPRVPKARPKPADVAAALEAVAQAQRPMILAGGGAITAGATPELVQLAEALGAPVAATTMGRGAVPEDHALALGWVRGKPAMAAIEQADLLIAIGCRFGEITTSHWIIEFPPLVHIDVDAKEIGKNIEPKVGMVADGKHAAKALVDKLGHARRDPWFDKPDVGDGRDDMLDNQIVPIMRSILDRDAIVAADVGQTAFAMFTRFPVYEPRTFIHPAMYIAMGHALPAALGAKVGKPDRQVACIIGDGAFMMVCQEMATAVQEKLTVPVIVINDRELGAIKRIQRREFGARYFAADLLNPDFGLLAQSFGVGHARVAQVDAFEPALRAALAARGPTLIEVVKPGIE